MNLVKNLLKATHVVPDEHSHLFILIHDYCHMCRSVGKILDNLAFEGRNMHLVDVSATSPIGKECYEKISVDLPIIINICKNERLQAYTSKNQDTIEEFVDKCIRNATHPLILRERAKFSI